MSKLKVVPGAPNEIIFEREFDAPRRLVWKAMSEPALIKRWMGGKRSTVSSTEVDLRVGGRYRNAFRTPDGHEFAFVGEYREISDGRIVHTEQMEGAPGEAVVTITLTEHGGKTAMRMVMAFESKELRDMVEATGMADGAGESYDELDALLTNL